MKPLRIALPGLLFSATLRGLAQDDTFTDGFEYEGAFSRFGLNVEYWRGLGGDYDSFTLGTFSWEERHEHAAFGITIGGGNVELARGSFTDLQTGNPYLLETSLFVRYYLTGSSTPLRPYFAASVNVINLGWSYRTPVVSGNNVIRSDYAQGMGGYAGVGLSLELSRRLNMFGEVGVGAVDMLDTTSEGLKNDLFDSFTFASVKAGVSFSF